jgi:hypothetical protein
MRDIVCTVCPPMDAPRADPTPKPHITRVVQSLLIVQIFSAKNRLSTNIEMIESCQRSCECVLPSVQAPGCGGRCRAIA